MEEGRIKKSGKNLVTGIIYQTVTLVLGFVSRKVFLFTLGEEFLGLNGIFSDVLSLLSMADLGFNTAMSYSFYRPLAENDHEKLAALVNFYKKVYNIIAIAVTVIGIAVIPFLRFIVNTEKDIPYLELYYLFALAGIVISYMYVYKTTILTADQKNYVVTRITLWTNLIKSVAQIAVLVFFKNYIVYLALGIIFQLINNAIASHKAQQTYPYIMQKAQIDKQEQGAIFENMKSVFLYKLSGVLFSGVDNILISIMIGTAVVGLYNNYLMVSNRLLLIIQIFFSAITASVGNLIVKESEKKRYDVFNAVQSVSFILCGVIVSVFCLTINDLITVWLGGRFTLSLGLVLAVTVNTYMTCILQPLWAYRDATGLYRKTKYIMLVGAFLNIVFSIVLGKLIGIAGIIVASALARICSYFWYEPVLLFREYFGKSSGGYFFGLLKNLILVVATIYGLHFFTEYWVVDSWFTLIVEGTVVGSVCVIVFMLAYCRTPGFKMIIEKAKSFLKRSK